MIVGPSYQLQHLKADVQRSVNLYPVVNEVSGSKSVAYLESVPGLRRFSGRPGDALLQEDGVSYILLEQSSGHFLLET